MVHAFTISSVVRGYHEYKDIWSPPIDGTELSCERESGNPRDTSAVVRHDSYSRSFSDLLNNAVFADLFPLQ